MRLVAEVILRRGFRASRLTTAIMLRRGFQPSRLGLCSAAELRVLILRLGVAVMAMISPASGVWTLLFDDLSSLIFRQPTAHLGIVVTLRCGF